MRNKSLRTILIITIIILAILIDFPILGNVKEKIFKRNLDPVLGLDLRGGMQVLLQALKATRLIRILYRSLLPFLKTAVMH